MGLRDRKKGADIAANPYCDTLDQGGPESEGIISDDGQIVYSGTSGLLPCPFCGSPAEFDYTDYNPGTGEGDDGMGRAQCTNPECGIGFFDDRESAINKWNRRAKQDAARAAQEKEFKRIIS